MGSGPRHISGPCFPIRKSAIDRFSSEARLDSRLLLPLTLTPYANAQPPIQAMPMGMTSSPRPQKITRRDRHVQRLETSGAYRYSVWAEMERWVNLRSSPHKKRRQADQSHKHPSFHVVTNPSLFFTGGHSCFTSGRFSYIKLILASTVSLVLTRHQLARDFAACPLGLRLMKTTPCATTFISGSMYTWSY